MAILRIRDDQGNVTEILALRGEKGDKGDKGEKGDNAVTDQNYNPESKNAQSGKAVEEAIQSNIDQHADPTSIRAQSGVAVAEAINTVYDDFGTAIEMDYTVRRGDDGIYILLLDLIHEEIKDSTYFLVFEGVIDISVSATLNEIYNIGFALNKKYRIEIRDKKVVSLKVSDKIVDQTYNPESENAQSGMAVAEALATVGGNDFVLIGDATLTEPAAVFDFSSDLNGNPLSQYKDFFLYFYGSTTLGTSNRAFAVRANTGSTYFMWQRIGSVAADSLFGFWHSIEEIYNADDLKIWKSNFSATALLNVMENGAAQGLAGNNVSVSSDFSVSLKKNKITSIEFFLTGTSDNTYTVGSRCMLFGRARK